MWGGLVCEGGQCDGGVPEERGRGNLQKRCIDFVVITRYNVGAKRGSADSLVS
jgi:hypothetical protein